MNPELVSSSSKLGVVVEVVSCLQQNQNNIFVLTGLIFLRMIQLTFVGIATLKATKAMEMMSNFILSAVLNLQLSE